MLEAAIIIFGTAVGAMIFFDVCNMISHYTMLQQSANEGLRLASVLPGLEAKRETDLSPTEEEFTSCEDRALTSFSCQHFVAQSRVTTVLSILNEFDLSGLWFDSTSITTELVPSGSGRGFEDDTVIVEVRGRFRGLLLKRVTLVADAQGPYLYESI